MVVREPAAAGTATDVASWIDAAGTGRRQMMVVLMGFLVTTFDGFDTQAIAFTAPAIGEDLGVGPGGLTPVVTAGVAGMAVGAAAFGPLGDRIGRRLAIVLATATFGLFALATAGADSLWALAALRFLTGLGMGGATPNVLALAAEYAPARHRGVAMLGATIGLPIGAIGGAAVANAFLDVIGWRGIYLLGGALPLAYVLALLRWLPESPHYLLRSGREQAARAALARVHPQAPPPADRPLTLHEPAAGRGGLATLLAPPLRRTTLAVWTVYFCNWVTWFSFILWLPSALHAAGLEVAAAARGTMVVNGAALLFVIPLSWYLPRLPLRAVVVGLLALGVAACLVLAGAGSRWTLVFTTIGLAGLFIGGPQMALNYLCSVAYPTAARASGLGTAIGVGRAGTVVGAAAGGALIDAGGPALFYAALAAPLALATLAALAIRPAAAAHAASA